MNHHLVGVVVRNTDKNRLPTSFIACVAEITESNPTTNHVFYV